MLPIHEVPCPHCGAALYTSVSLDDGVPEGTPESPPVQGDGDALSMTCPQCGRRIALERYRAEGRAALRLGGAAGRINAEVHDARP